MDFLGIFVRYLFADNPPRIPTAFVHGAKGEKSNVSDLVCFGGQARFIAVSRNRISKGGFSLDTKNGQKVFEENVRVHIRFKKTGKRRKFA